ncbi:MAG: hypothetical protein IPN67_08175 [Bacteroidales bacterium]|nr:hypothetical protein [Bacteroidales bacterium]
MKRRQKKLKAYLYGVFILREAGFADRSFGEGQAKGEGQKAQGSGLRAQGSGWF